MPGWDRIYPDKRIVTLILDPFEAEELLAQALAEGRRIGERTIMGMPMIAFGEEPAQVEDAPPPAAVAQPADPADLETWRALGRKAASPPQDRPAPDDKVVILPVVRREPLPEALAPAPAAQPQEPSKPRTWSPSKDRARQQPPNTQRRSILDEQPPREPPPSPNARGGMSAADRALIDEAIAQGRVTKCPDFKHSVEPGQLLPGEGWKKGAAKKGKRKGHRDD